MSDLASFFASFDILTVAEWLDLDVIGTGGGRGKINCPVHGENTPSCHLYPEDGHYYCFGCQARGSIADLVMNVNAISFGEALDWLAERGKIDRPHQDPEAAARSAAWRQLREALREGLELSSPESLPSGLDMETAAGLGLGRAVQLAKTVEELPRPIMSLEEAAEWEGHWTIELHARGGVNGVGVYLPAGGEEVAAAADPASARFVRSGAARGPLLLGRGAAGEAIRAAGAVLITPDPGELLELHAGGYPGTVSPGEHLTDASAALLAELAPRLVLVATPARRAAASQFRNDLAALLHTGRSVAIAARRPEGDLAPAVPLFAYLANVAGKMEPQIATRFLMGMLAVLPSPSTRALYGAELQRRGLLSA